MTMINVWYPKEIGEGVEIKEVASRKDDFGQLGPYLQDRLNVGHSSLMLDRLSTPVYLSWWPQAPATKTPTWKLDVALEGGLPNVMISLDDLDERAIADWWKSLVGARRGERGGYDLASYNCSTVVAQALAVGGAERLAVMPAVSVWTPARVEDWANALLVKSTARTNRIFRHEGIGDLVDSAARRIVSELGARVVGG